MAKSREMKSEIIIIARKQVFIKKFDSGQRERTLHRG